MTPLEVAPDDDQTNPARRHHRPSEPVDPVIPAGGAAIDTATGVIKVGNGTDRFSELPAADHEHLSVCVAADTWLRAPIAAWTE